MVDVICAWACMLDVKGVSERGWYSARFDSYILF